MAVQQILIYWDSMITCWFCIPVFNLEFLVIIYYFITSIGVEELQPSPRFLDHTWMSRIECFRPIFSVAITKFLSFETAYPNSRTDPSHRSYLPCLLISLPDLYALYFMYCLDLPCSCATKCLVIESAGPSLCSNSAEHSMIYHTITLAKTCCASTSYPWLNLLLPSPQRTLCCSDYTLLW